MRDIIAKLNKIENLQEGKYGAHGKDLDSAIDKAISKLGDSPSLDEIYAQVKKIRRNEDIGGMFATKGYREAAALGAIAKALGLPGLYKDGGNGRTFVSTKQDDANRFEETGGTSKKNAELLAQKGFLTTQKAEKLGLEVAKEEPAGADKDVSADAEKNTKVLKLANGKSYKESDRDALQKQVFDVMLKRYMELANKMNESAPVSLRGYLKEYHVYLTEALTDAEKKELAYLYQELSTIQKFKFNAGEENEVPALSSANQRMIQAQLDRVDIQSLTASTSPEDPDADIDAQGKAAADAGLDDKEKDDDKKDSKPSGSLEAFAKSGKKGIANNPEEKEAITELQQALTDMGFDPNGVDGRYGPGTRKAVSAFQEMMGAKVDGDAGPETIGAIVKARTLPGVKEFYDDLKRMKELADKAGEEGANESSMRYWINLLNEALSDAEQKEFDELYNKHKAKFDDAEYAASLPSTMTTLMKTVSDYQRSADGEEPAAKDAEVDPEKIRDIVVKIRAYMGHVITGLSTNEDKLKAALDRISSKAEYEAVLTAYQNSPKTGPLRTGDLLADLQGSLDSTEYEEIVDATLKRLGIGDSGEGAGKPDDEKPKPIADKPGDEVDTEIEPGVKGVYVKLNGKDYVVDPRPVKTRRGQTYYNGVRASRFNPDGNNAYERLPSQFNDTIAKTIKGGSAKPTAPQDKPGNKSTDTATDRKPPARKQTSQNQLDPAVLANLEKKIGDSIKTIARLTPEEQAKKRSQFEPEARPYFDALLKKAQGSGAPKPKTRPQAPKTPGLDQLPKDF